MYKWNMGGTPKELYDTGVTVSMEERKATIGDYLKSEKVPAAYSDPSDSGKDIAAVSTVTRNIMNQQVLQRIWSVF